MIHGIDHAALSVPDMDEALAFYRDVLGFEVLMNFAWPSGAEPLDRLVGLRDSASKVAMLKLGDTKLEIFEYQKPVGKAQDPDRPVCDHGIIHLCFAVSDIAKEHERLEQAGVRFNSAPIDMGAETCVYGRDPFGNVLELIERR